MHIAFTNAIPSAFRSAVGSYSAGSAPTTQVTNPKQQAQNPALRLYYCLYPVPFCTINTVSLLHALPHNCYSDNGFPKHSTVLWEQQGEVAQRRQKGGHSGFPLSQASTACLGLHQMNVFHVLIFCCCFASQASLPLKHLQHTQQNNTPVPTVSPFSRLQSTDATGASVYHAGRTSTDPAVFSHTTDSAVVNDHEKLQQSSLPFGKHVVKSLHGYSMR